MEIPAGATQIYDEGIGAFTEEELDRLVAYCDALPIERAPLNGKTGTRYDDAIRVTQVSSVRQAPDIMWLYERLAAIVHGFNNRSFQFDLRGFSEPPQYMVYRDADGGHFDWHMDTGPIPPRKLSLTLQLTDPAHYQGCQLQFNTGTGIVAAPSNRGAAIAFPSYMMHRVTPITSGTRRALVAWVTGPRFK